MHTPSGEQRAPRRVIARLAAGVVVAALLSAALTFGLAGALAEPSDGAAAVTALASDDLLPGVLPAPVALVVTMVTVLVLLAATRAQLPQFAVAPRDRSPPPTIDR